MLKLAHAIESRLNININISDLIFEKGITGYNLCCFPGKLNYFIKEWLKFHKWHGAYIIHVHLYVIRVMNSLDYIFVTIVTNQWIILTITWGIRQFQSYWNWVYYSDSKTANTMQSLLESGTYTSIGKCVGAYTRV